MEETNNELKLQMNYQLGGIKIHTKTEKYTLFCTVRSWQ